ncbi:MAG: hypothetical protein RO469_05430 [Thermincola sp.]|nr:hypothetical protein [Thermincola sp.]MDT3704740.1 hypothetical protein [Thermincola sp.]
MPTIEEGSVFEYCERLYRELDEKDGGYYPSRHDKYVFSKAATNFAITEEEVDRIFNEYSKQAADIEMEKIKRLPIAVRKKILLKKASDIMKNNRDLPFFKIEGPPSEEIPSALDLLSDEYRAVIESIAQTGWTIPINIDIRRFNELMKISGDERTLDKYFSEFYDGREFKFICRKITKAIANPAQKTIFTECVKAFESELYSVCLTTLISVLEGFISTFGDNPQDVRIMRICSFHAGEEMKKKNNIKSLCWLSMYEFTKQLYQKSDFSQPEPDTINRHWIQHGRTGRSGERIDCIRVFNALSTMVNIKQYIGSSIK